MGRVLGYMLNAFCDQKQNEDEEQQTYAAARIVAPVAAMRPGGESSDTQYEKND